MTVVADSFAAFRQVNKKWFGDDPKFKAFQGALGSLYDDCFERWVEAAQARLPSYCAADGLQFIGQERGLERGISESEDGYRGVLRAAWTAWAIAGSAAGHQYHLGRLGFEAVSVRRRREFAGLPPTGTPYLDAFQRDVWAQFDLILGRPMPWRARYWGSGTWGSRVWGADATPQQVAQVRRFARTFRAGHDTPMWLWLNFGAGQLWGVGAWGSGVWGGSGSVVKMLVGEPHWQQRFGIVV